MECGWGGERSGCLFLPRSPKKRGKDPHKKVCLIHVCKFVASSASHAWVNPRKGQRPHMKKETSIFPLKTRQRRKRQRRSNVWFKSFLFSLYSPSVSKQARASKTEKVLKGSISFHRSRLSPFRGQEKKEGWWACIQNPFSLFKSGQKATSTSSCFSSSTWLLVPLVLLQNGGQCSSLSFMRAIKMFGVMNGEQKEGKRRHELEKEARVWPACMEWLASVVNRFGL